MTAITDTGSYALARSDREYERLREQARAWEAATGRLLDQVDLGIGASCLDAGCGPGETMRLLAQRVGPAGRVLGIDVDVRLGTQALAMLHGAGHRQCEFAGLDITGEDPVPGAPFDLVYARLLLYHLPGRLAALRRLWDAVAPGGHLLVQDYVVDATGVTPPLNTVTEALRVVMRAFEHAGCDVNVGRRLPRLFTDAGIGAPDGTDVAGRLEPLAQAQWLLAGVHAGVLGTALAYGVTTEQRSAEWRAAFAADVERHPDAPVLWPLLVGAWKRKPA